MSVIRTSKTFVRSRIATLTIAALAALTATTVLADPPPMPRFKIVNRTPFTVTAGWTVEYKPLYKEKQWFDIASVAIPPWGNVERAFPNRLQHTVIDSHPDVTYFGPKGGLNINGTNLCFRPPQYGGGCVSGVTNMQTPAGWYSSYDAYQGKFIRINSSTGTPWSATAQDYVDVYVDWN